MIGSRKVNVAKHRYTPGVTVFIGAADISKVCVIALAPASWVRCLGQAGIQLVALRALGMGELSAQQPSALMNWGMQDGCATQSRHSCVLPWLV